MYIILLSIEGSAVRVHEIMVEGRMVEGRGERRGRDSNTARGTVEC